MDLDVISVENSLTRRASTLTRSGAFLRCRAGDECSYHLAFVFFIRRPGWAKHRETHREWRGRPEVPPGCDPSPFSFEIRRSQIFGNSGKTSSTLRHSPPTCEADPSDRRFRPVLPPHLIPDSMAAAEHGFAGSKVWVQHAAFREFPCIVRASLRFRWPSFFSANPMAA